MDNDLPKGYGPLKGIKYKKKTLPNFTLTGFASYEEAHNRYKELREHSSNTNFGLFPEGGFFVVVTEDVFSYLSEEEKKRLLPGPFTIETVYYTPMIYRFIPEEYIDEFFSTGKLRLSTFRKCKELEDSNRRDSTEGSVTLLGKEDQFSIKIGMGIGDNALLLCASLSSNNVKFDGTRDDCCLLINDTQRFTDAVAQFLVDNGYPLKTILMGPCLYADREIQRTLSGNRLDGFTKKTDETHTLDMDMLFSMAGDIGQKDVFFCKPVEKRFENEYRILWLLDDDVNADYIDVIIPEARSFCKKIKYS